MVSEKDVGMVYWMVRQWDGLSAMNLDFPSGSPMVSQMAPWLEQDLDVLSATVNLGKVWKIPSEMQMATRTGWRIMEDSSVHNLVVLSEDYWEKLLEVLWGISMA